jgi:hypothetical protein
MAVAVVTGGWLSSCRLFRVRRATYPRCVYSIQVHQWADVELNRGHWTATLCADQGGRRCRVATWQALKEDE